MLNNSYKTMVKRQTLQQKKESFQQILKLVKSGISPEDACDRVGVTRTFIDKLPDQQRNEINKAVAVLSKIDERLQESSRN